jgi:hypothetical protein
MNNSNLEPPKPDDVDYIPKTKLATLTINYWGGFRYHILHDGEIATSILNNKMVYVGINTLYLTPVLMEKDPRARSQSAITQGASSSALSGKDAGVWLVDAETEDFVQPAHLNPHIETLRQDRITHHKSVLLGIADLPANTLGEILARNEDNNTIVRQMVLGLPMKLPSYTGYATTPNSSQNNPVK